MQNTPPGRHNLQNTPVFENYSNYPRKKMKLYTTRSNKKSTFTPYAQTVISINLSCLLISFQLRLSYWLSASFVFSFAFSFIYLFINFGFVYLLN